MKQVFVLRAGAAQESRDGRMRSAFENIADARGINAGGAAYLGSRGSVRRFLISKFHLLRSSFDTCWLGNGFLGVGPRPRPREGNRIVGGNRTSSMFFLQKSEAKFSRLVRPDFSLENSSLSFVPHVPGIRRFPLDKTLDKIQIFRKTLIKKLCM